MNALSRKVLQEVLSGLFIMEPNRRVVGSEEEEDAPKRRGFWDRANLRFGAMTH